MKKIALLLVCAFSVFAFAQKAPVNKTVGVKSNLQVTKEFPIVKNAMQQKVRPAATPEMCSTVKKGNVDLAKDMNRPVVEASKIAKAEENPFFAFFYKPEGTFFCGISKEGNYVWFNYPSLVGAWRNGLNSWTYKNASAGAEKIKWTSRLYDRYPQYFTVTAEGNLVDSTTQFYPWGGSIILPALYAYKDQEQVKDSFVLLGFPDEPIDTTLSNTCLWNGFVNPASEDGMFPLTKAMVFNSVTGMDYSAEFVWSLDSVTHDISYIYGTEPLQYDDTTVVEASAILVEYEKPQAPLFINEISVAVNALTYVADSAKYYRTRPTFNKLGVSILSADLKTLIAQSVCSIADTTNNDYFPGSMLHFSFVKKDEYGMIISEGITLNEPFVVMLSGLNQEGANFGIVSSLNPYYAAKTYIIDTAYNAYKAPANFDPYIMLNGVFYTLEDFSELYGLDNYGDTINVAIKYENGFGYYAVHADGELEGYMDQLIAASEMLYDTVTYQYNYNIIAPDWVNILEMEWMYDEETDLWDNYNCYYLYIQGAEEYMEPGTELPKVGDEIILSKYGHELVFKVVEVDGTQGIETVGGNQSVQTKKVIRDGQLIIERNGVKYNATGAKL